MCTNEGLPASHGSVLKMFCLFMPFLQPASRIYDSVSKHCVIHRECTGIVEEGISMIAHIQALKVLPILLSTH